jgi:Holliday junction resolvase RusA-like endonuclease
MKIDSPDPVTIALVGAPVAKGRPRISAWRGRVRVRTPEATRVYEEAFRLTAFGQMRGRNPFAVPVEVLAQFVFAPPASWSEKKRLAAIAGDIPHAIKPDIDNLQKSVLDALNCIVFADDALVVKISAEKRYGQASLAVVTVRPLAPEELL